MNRIKQLFGDSSMSFEEFSAAAKEAHLLILEGDEGSYVPASREAELLGELSAARDAHQSELSRIRAESAFRQALVLSGAHNPELAMRAVDISDLEGDDIYKAAETKAAALREAEPYLFRTVGAPVSTGAVHGSVVTDTDTMSDAEYYRHINLK